MPSTRPPESLRATWQAAAERCAPAFGDNVAPMLAVFAEGAVERAAIRPGARVVDIWCGPGSVTSACALRAGPAGLAVGADPSAAGARPRSPPARPSIVSADPVSLPFAEGAFGAAVSAFGLPAWDRDREFAEALRCLRPGGTLSLVHLGPSQIEPMQKVTDLLQRFRTDRPSAKLEALRAAAGPVEGMRRDVRTPSELRAAANAAGFDDVSVHQARVRQRLWGITNFVDVCLSFPLPHAEHAEMEPDAKDLFITVCQEVLLPFMDLEEFIAAADLVYLTARRPGGRR